MGWKYRFYYIFFLSFCCTLSHKATSAQHHSSHNKQASTVVCRRRAIYSLCCVILHTIMLTDTHYFISFRIAKVRKNSLANVSEMGFSFSIVIDRKKPYIGKSPCFRQSTREKFHTIYKSHALVCLLYFTILAHPLSVSLALPMKDTNNIFPHKHITNCTNVNTKVYQKIEMNAYFSREWTTTC